MEYVPEIINIWLIHVLAWFTPGPLFVLIVRNSLMYSRVTGFWTAVGIAFGNTVHITYSIIGFTVLLESNDAIFQTIKLLGVGYLTYLGVKTFHGAHKLKKISTKHDKNQEDLTPFAAAKTGFLTNILSPKASLFFATVIGTFSSSGAPTWATTTLSIIMILNSLIMATLLSLFFTHPALRTRYRTHSAHIMRLLSAALLTFAVIILFS